MYTWREDGEANKYVILRHTEWFMAIHMNGEMSRHEQTEYMKSIVSLLNLEQG